MDALVCAEPILLDKPRTGFAQGRQRVRAEKDQETCNEYEHYFLRGHKQLAAFAQTNSTEGFLKASAGRSGSRLKREKRKRGSRKT
jgi:hypothetical protein